MGIKIVFGGSSAAGRSTLIHRYIHGSFKSMDLTVGIDFKLTKVQFNGKEFRMFLWDTSGQERFANITSVQMKIADVIVMSFDVGNEDSFQTADHRISVLKRDFEKTGFVLAGLKTDLIARRVIFEDKALELAKKYNAPYFECSSKTGDGVEALFNGVFKFAYRKYIATASLQIELSVSKTKDLERAQKGKMNIENDELTTKKLYIDSEEGDEKAFKLLSKRANKDVEAKHYLALAYYNGIRTERELARDYNKAIKWFQKAAKNGDFQALSNLGVCYYYGHGVKQDYKKTIKIFQEAIEKGNVGALRNLGYCYEMGHGVLQDEKQAEKFYRSAASKGDEEARIKLDALLEQQRINAFQQKQIEYPKQEEIKLQQEKEIKRQQEEAKIQKEIRKRKEELKESRKFLEEKKQSLEKEKSKAQITTLPDVIDKTDVFEKTTEEKISLPDFQINHGKEEMVESWLESATFEEFETPAIQTIQEDAFDDDQMTIFSGMTEATTEKIHDCEHIILRSTSRSKQDKINAANELAQLAAYVDVSNRNEILRILKTAMMEVVGTVKQAVGNALLHISCLPSVPLEQQINVLEYMAEQLKNSDEISVNLKKEAEERLQKRIESLPVDHLIERLENCTKIQDQCDCIKILIDKIKPSAIGCTASIKEVKKVIPVFVEIIGWSTSETGLYAAQGFIDLATYYPCIPKKMAFEQLKDFLLNGDAKVVEETLGLFHQLVGKLGAEQLKTLHDTLRFLYDENLRTKKKMFIGLTEEQKAINQLAQAMQGETLRVEEFKENLKKVILFLIKGSIKIGKTAVL